MDERILACLSQRIQQALVKCSVRNQQGLEEIRIRVERPIELRIHNRSVFLTPSGHCSPFAEEGMIATVEDGHKMMNLISRHSVYAIEEELRRGYITVSGGHRVGIAGRAVVDGGKVKFLKDIKSFNVRVAREMKGIANPIIAKLFADQKFKNTLIVSPPQCGKTTLLRDLIRLLSYGVKAHTIHGHKVGVVDERSELASCINGIPQHDLGPRVDVLDACPKAEGMMMMIRSMSPEVLACDEIGSTQDTQSVLEALHAGVAILTTAHGSSIHDVKQRPSLRPLFEQPVFDRFLILSKRDGVGTVEAIYDRTEGRGGISLQEGMTHVF